MAYHQPQVGKTTLRLAGVVAAKSGIGKWMASVIGGDPLVGLYGLFNRRKAMASNPDPGQQKSSR